MKKNLGRGLSSLMGDVNDIVKDDVKDEPKGKIEKIHYIPLEKICINKDQPRKSWCKEGMQELAESIKKSGVISPIIVTRVTDEAMRRSGGEYLLVAGERRLIASYNACRYDIPAIIREDLDKVSIFELAIIENVQRENMNAVDEAMAYMELIEDYSYTQNDVAKIIGKSRSYVANMLRLTTLPESVLKNLAEGKLSIGHARAVLSVDDPEAFAEEIINNSLSVRETESLVRQKKEDIFKKRRLEDRIKTDLRVLEDVFSGHAGLPVKISKKPDGKGKIIIHYKSPEDIDRILDVLVLGARKYLPENYKLED